MAGDLCRNGLHPLEGNRERDGRGGTRCRPCRETVQARRNMEVPIDQAVLADQERQARLAAWIDGVDAAIAEMRRTEGFDGETREWRTLGDVVGMRAGAPVEPPTQTETVAAPAPVAPPTPIRELPPRPVSQWRTYKSISPAARRFQELARQDVGTLVG